MTDRPQVEHAEGVEQRADHHRCAAEQTPINRAETRRRLFAALAAFLVLVGTLSEFLGPTRAVLVSFDIAATGFLIATLRMIRRIAPGDMPLQYGGSLRGRGALLATSVAGSVVVLVALSVELQHNVANPLGQVVLAAVSLILSWLFMNTMFAMYYADAFYNDGAHGPGGLAFPGTATPDYWDFVYFAFVLGMTFQVADVQITSRGLRQTALLHGVLAFFFNVVVIALTVNAVAANS